VTSTNGGSIEAAALELRRRSIGVQSAGAASHFRPAAISLICALPISVGSEVEVRESGRFDAVAGLACLSITRLSLQQRIEFGRHLHHHRCIRSMPSRVPKWLGAGVTGAISLRND
jgi:hypothetical protein